MDPAAGPYITGWSALSPFGVGREPFAAGLAAGGGEAVTDPEHGPGLRVRDFDPASLLAPRSIRTLDRMTLMSITVAGLLLDEHADSLGPRSGSVGLVLGTSTGSIDSIVGFTKDTFVQDKPYFVDPAAFPNTVINGVAGRTAIWHGLRGLNSTVSAGHLTALATLRYATRLIRRGYAETLLVGAVEELSAPVALAAGRLRETWAAPARTSLGEGCVMFLVDSGATARREGREPLAAVADLAFGVTLPDDPPWARADHLAGLIESVLRRNGLEPDRIGAVSLAQSGESDLDEAERQALDRALGADHGRRVQVSRQVGDCFSALGAFQLAALLAEAAPDARPALVTSLGADGAAACALITS
ncbi:hypothetical protein KGA66_04850 [Actinocrinis puniceicyclus]|uniref:Beta-ketoacyl synthase-like N-terminal domain-containing protein n=1 Tax=Actinocrinis puniceicyclus TaxID=977794 RepID=A0A8J8BD26_9ACTN|nr:beta-ketoacyl synthase N-terminal-like domain-containing protein [Actinocrinis puniceicyclus]MBS2962364.1 hypothetical protein [Actinocrinis puniceicyclus]